MHHIASLFLNLTSDQPKPKRERNGVRIGLLQIPPHRDQCDLHHLRCRYCWTWGVCVHSPKRGKRANNVKYYWVRCKFPHHGEAGTVFLQLLRAACSVLQRDGRVQLRPPLPYRLHDHRRRRHDHCYLRLLWRHEAEPRVPDDILLCSPCHLSRSGRCCCPRFCLCSPSSRFRPDGLGRVSWQQHRALDAAFRLLWVPERHTR
mmetsp:Transcript_42649/g.109835  ORF Transcript_42649/g.109835 Transcript_42649/m.109835 type:complete len:203 (+) Transcript_42649:154-762(+)